MIKIIILKLFLLLAIFSAQGQTLLIDSTFYQDSLNKWYDLSESIDFQEDTEEALSILNLAQYEEKWSNLPSTNQLKWNENLWLRISIQNQLDRTIDLAFLLSSDELTAWLIPARDIRQPMLGGSLRKRSTWNSQKYSPVFSSPHTLQFELPALSKQTLYIHLKVNDRALPIAPKLSNRSFFLSYSVLYFNRIIFTQSFIQGILWIMLLYHLAIFWMNRARAYLYYSIYIFCLSLMLFYSFGLHHFTALSELPRLSRLLVVAGTCGVGICYALFQINFLHQNEWRSDLKRLILRYIKATIILSGVVLILLLLPVSVFKLVDRHYFLLPFFTVGMFGLLWISWQYWYSGHTLARYIAANNFFLVCGFFVTILILITGSLGWVNLRDTSYWGMLFLEAMFILQMLSFSLGLSHKGLETERERTRLQELDQLKSRFFANISHEFRTPLTLILGPLRQLRATVNQSHARKQLQTVETYAQKLLRMVNQILDLTKLEAGKMELNRETFDLINLTKNIVYSFESIAVEQNIRLNFESNKSVWQVIMDQDKIEQILINLISNAVKYNRQNGEIKVLLEIQKDEAIKIQVEDTGIGITEEALPYIFQLYYQGNHKDFTNKQSSSGIGLAFVKELIELHEGKINVNSKEGEGSVFTVFFPPNTAEANGSNSSKLVNDILLPRKKLITASKVSSKEEQALVLVVEDHQDIQVYIQTCLQEDFQLLFASDGKKGLKMAQQQVPDLIITDVMMPKMDGFALTKALKEHTITSHIPIIILTGKSSKASKLEGLKTQADEYLTKPFDAEELQLRIRNLLNNRQKWISHFQSKNGKLVAPEKPFSMDDLFLQKVEEIVQENISNENFTVEQLGRTLHLDRTQLFRKLKALTGENPSHFIRTTRLKTAYQLLENQTATVAEIAFQVGFSNTSYFSRSFKKYFGKTPGEIRQ